MEGLAIEAEDFELTIQFQHRTEQPYCLRVSGLVPKDEKGFAVNLVAPVLARFACEANLLEPEVAASNRAHYRVQARFTARMEHTPYELGAGVASRVRGRQLGVDEGLELVFRHSQKPNVLDVVFRESSQEAADEFLGRSRRRNQGLAFRSRGLIFHSLVAGTGSGLGYGGIWWVLGPLTLMPLMMGMGTNWNGAAAAAMFPSLVGHLVYGLILGCTYAWLARRAHPVSGPGRTAGPTA